MNVGELLVFADSANRVAIAVNNGRAVVLLSVVPGDIVRITAVVAGTMDPRRTWDMIHRFEASTALVAIPEITVRSDGANQTFSVTLQGFYRVPPDQGAAP